MANFTNDENMKYDINLHRYVITDEAVASRYGISILDTVDSTSSTDTDQLSARLLSRVAMIIYTYIYRHAAVHDETEYVLSLPRYRQFIEDAELELCYAMLINNTDPSIFYGDVNIDVLCPSSYAILASGGLLFRGRYVFLPDKWYNSRGVDY